MASASCVFAFNAFQGLLFCSKSIRPCDLRLSHFQSFAKPENTRRRLKFAFAAGLQFDWLRLGNFTTFKWHIFLFGRIQSNHTGDEQPCSDTSPLLSDYAFCSSFETKFCNQLMTTFNNSRSSPKFVSQKWTKLIGVKIHSFTKVTLSLYDDGD